MRTEPGRLSSIGSNTRRIGIGVVGVLAAVAIYWLHQHVPSYAERLQPIVLRSELGQTVQARGFNVRIPRDAALQTARTLVTPAIIGRPRQTPTTGLWLSLPVQLESTLNEDSIAAFLQDRKGRQYLPMQRDWIAQGDKFTDGDVRGLVYDNNLNRKRLSPGFPENGRLYFELPADALTGLHARFYLGPIMQSNDHVVDIDLAIDGQKAAALQTGAAEELRTYTLREIRK